MQKAFTDYVDGLANESSSQSDSVTNLQHLGGCVHMAKEELQEQVNAVKDMAREHSKWLIRYTNVHVSRLEELISTIVAANAHKAKLDKEKN